MYRGQGAVCSGHGPEVRHSAYCFNTRPTLPAPALQHLFPKASPSLSPPCPAFKAQPSMPSPPCPAFKAQPSMPSPQCPAFKACQIPVQCLLPQPPHARPPKPRPLPRPARLTARQPARQTTRHPSRQAARQTSRQTQDEKLPRLSAGAFRGVPGMPHSRRSNFKCTLLQETATRIKVLGGGGVGEATLLQKGPSPTKDYLATAPEHLNFFKVEMLYPSFICAMRFLSVCA